MVDGDPDQAAADSVEVVAVAAAGHVTNVIRRDTCHGIVRMAMPVAVARNVADLVAVAVVPASNVIRRVTFHGIVRMVMPAVAAVDGGEYNLLFKIQG